MRHRPRLAALIACVLPALATAADPADAKVAFFEKKIRPLLAGHCYACHSADTKPAGQLRVDDRNGLLAGGNGGPAVVPGKPAESLLLKRVAGGKRQMPLEGDHLSAEEVADLTAWIADGAAWPAVKVPALGKPKPKYEALKRDHWAWQPPGAPAVPAVRDATWPRDDVDRFVLAKLEARGLAPVGDADRVALVRRLTFDLTGLPPTPAEIDAFAADQSPDAAEKLVDRPARVAALRRTLGPALARRGPLRRVHRPVAQHPVPARLEVPRLRHRRRQRRRAVRPLRPRAGGRRPAARRLPGRARPAGHRDGGFWPWASRT